MSSQPAIVKLVEKFELLIKVCDVKNRTHAWLGRKKGVIGEKFPDRVISRRGDLN